MLTAITTRNIVKSSIDDIDDVDHAREDVTEDEPMTRAKVKPSGPRKLKDWTMQIGRFQTSSPNGYGI